MITRILLFAAISSIGPYLALGETRFDDPGEKPANAKIEQLLDQRRDMVFNDRTLLEFAATLTSYGIPTYLDERGLDLVGVTADQLVTFQQKSIRLRDCLDLLLTELECAWSVHNGRLVITSAEQAGEQLITRVYDVRNLVELTPIPYGGKLAYQYDFDTLIEAIIHAIEPESWDEAGGQGTIQPFYTRRMRVLVVSQTYEVHRQVQALLDKLTEHGGSTPLSFAPAHSPPSNKQSRAQTATFQSSRQKSGIHSSQLRTSGQ